MSQKEVYSDRVLNMIPSMIQHIFLGGVEWIWMPSRYASEWCQLNQIRVDLVEIGLGQYSPSSFGVQRWGEVVFRDNDVVLWGF